MLTLFTILLFILVILVMIYLNVQVNEFENKYKQLENILITRFQEQKIPDDKKEDQQKEQITKEDEK